MLLIMSSTLLLPGEQEQINHLKCETQTPRMKQETQNFLTSLMTLDKVACKYCHATRVDFMLRQTRSADEGMTAFYICRACEKSWRG